MNQNPFEGLEEQLKVEREKVDVSSVDFSVREIVRMYEDGELSIAPSYQRKYRWPSKVASTFIESIFLGLPIPPIFVATNDDFELEVVDGLQRISTLILFMSADEQSRRQVRKDPGTTDPLVLSELEKLSQLNGTGYSDLPVGIQRYFSRLPLQVISLTDRADKQVRFDLFERLNTGSIKLTPQEVRTAVYAGAYIDFVEDLSSDANFGTLLKLQESNKYDGTTAEQVLKYFAYKNNRDSFNGAVTKFLNNYIESGLEDFNYVHERKVFLAAVAFLNDLIGGPFLREGTNITPLVQFEACLVGVGELIEEGVSPSAPSVDWRNDPELVEASTGGSNTKSKLNRRIERAKVLFGGGA